jgi:hypothetical protein
MVILNFNKTKKYLVYNSTSQAGSCGPLGGREIFILSKLFFLGLILFVFLHL